MYPRGRKAAHREEAVNVACVVVPPFLAVELNQKIKVYYVSDEDQFIDPFHKDVIADREFCFRVALKISIPQTTRSVGVDSEFIQNSIESTTGDIEECLCCPRT